MLRQQRRGSEWFELCGSNRAILSRALYDKDAPVVSEVNLKHRQPVDWAASVMQAFCSVLRLLFLGHRRLVSVRVCTTRTLPSDQFRFERLQRRFHSSDLPFQRARGIRWTLLLVIATFRNGNVRLACRPSARHPM